MGDYESKDETRNGYARENQEKKGKGRGGRLRKRTFSVANRGGFLPLLPLLGVFSFLAGGAARITKAVNDGKAARQRLEELQRHNRAMDGHLYHTLYKGSENGAYSIRKRKC